MVACQSLSVETGVTFGQFRYFMQQAEEQVSMLILEARANDLLFIEEEEPPMEQKHTVPVIH
ncbi:hypothetical protein [Martelella alba]|uniref:hypothetical protein n=1 Tax=Martelella alba TaxID=2590451 RepID=UPI001E5C1B91|nr:hypothetical protein [Martelella alba]